MSSTIFQTNIKLNCPNFQYSKPVDKDLNWTPEWQMIMQQIIDFIQSHISSEGILVPSQTTGNVTVIAGDSNTQDGTIIYESTLNRFIGKQAGSFVSILTGPYP